MSDQSTPTETARVSAELVQGGSGGGLMEYDSVVAGTFVGKGLVGAPYRLEVSSVPAPCSRFLSLLSLPLSLSLSLSLCYLTSQLLCLTATSLLLHFCLTATAPIPGFCTSPLCSDFCISLAVPHLYLTWTSPLPHFLCRFHLAASHFCLHRHRFYPNPEPHFYPSWIRAQFRRIGAEAAPLDQIRLAPCKRLGSFTQPKSSEWRETCFGVPRSRFTVHGFTHQMTLAITPIGPRSS